MNKKKYKRKKQNKKYVEWIEREETVKAPEMVKDTITDNEVKDSFAPLQDTFHDEIKEENTNIASLEELIKEEQLQEEKEDFLPKESKRKPNVKKIIFWTLLVIVDLLILALFFKVFNGWRISNNEDGYYYYKMGNPVAGFYVVDDKEYYFNDSRLMTEGWIEVKDHYYYQTMDEGIYKGERELDGNTYNFNSDGHLLRGIEPVDGILYIYDDYGYLYSGLITIDNKTYLANEEGMVSGGFNEYEGNRYYFDTKDGHMLTGTQVIDGHTYLFADNGIMQTGFIDYEGSIHLFDEFTGRMMAGSAIHYKGNYYRFDETGAMITGFYQDGDDTYYYDSEGKMLTGWMTLADGYQYYDSKGKRVYGWYEIEDNMYFFDEETGYMYTGWKYEDDKEYYFKEDGSAAVGFTFIDNKCYYFNVKYCRFKNTGFNLIEGKRYYFNNDYSILFGWQDIEGSRYYFDSQGAMAVGLRTIGSNQYYFYNDGKMAVNTKIDKYVVDANGIVSDPFKTITKDNLDLYIKQLLDKNGSDLNSIYLYCKSFKYKYREKSDVTTMACRMLNYGSGACWDYAALCYKMMTAAGYNCKIVIGKGAVYSEHNWLLVEVSPGVWRHVDPERQGYNIFLLTDAELEAYDGIRSNVRYQWDHSAYPAAN